MSGAPVPAGPLRGTTDRLGEKRYVAAGDRAYVVGTLDGRFPPLGWHISGAMGGIWAPPLRLFAGYEFAVDGVPLPPAARFQSGAGYVQMELPPLDGLIVTRTEFAPDGLPVLLVGLTLTNSGPAPRALALTLAAQSDLRAAYPWDFSRPQNSTAFNGPDKAAFDSAAGTLLFHEPGQGWHALVGALPAPARGVTEGPPSAGDDPASLKGARGELGWDLTLGGGETQTLWCAFAGSHTGLEEARADLAAALAAPAHWLAAKIAARLALLERSRVTLPDAPLQAAFDWGKLNLADGRLTVHDVAVRFVDQGRRYPAPGVTLPVVSGVVAGYPDYAWYFGTDGAYTAYALIATGQWETALDHLRAMRDFSRAVNGPTGKVVHEVVTDGSVFFGGPADPGNSNETAQVAAVVELAWRWSGDDAFRDEMYEFVRDGLHYLTSTLDRDGDGWPEGWGIIEQQGMGAEKLDVAVYTWRALRGLVRLAQSKGDAATATWAGDHAAAMAAAFDAAWWMPGESLYADSLCNGPEATGRWNRQPPACAVPGTPLQQRHWINVTPMEVGLAPPARAAAALTRLESAVFTGPAGLYHTGQGGGPDGQGALRVWTLPAGAMAVAEANYGRLGDTEALFYMRAIAALLDLEQPGALPEIAPGPAYDALGPLRERAMLMQTWSAYGIHWPVVHSFLGISPDVPAGRLAVVPAIPPAWPGLSIANLRVGRGSIAVDAQRNGVRYTTRVTAPAGWDLSIGHTLPPAAAIATATLDDAPVAYTVEDTPRGREVHVETTTGPVRTLAVQIV
jgi:glycogen debranching enzyme